MRGDGSVTAKFDDGGETDGYTFQYRPVVAADREQRSGYTDVMQFAEFE